MSKAKQNPLDLPPKPGKLFLDICKGVAGRCIYIGDEKSMYRIVGPKPWGGGITEQRFSVDIDELKEAIASYEERNK